MLPLFSAAVAVPPVGLDISYTFSQPAEPFGANFGIMLSLGTDSGPRKVLLGDSLGSLGCGCAFASENSVKLQISSI